MEWQSGAVRGEHKYLEDIALSSREWRGKRTTVHNLSKFCHEILSQKCKNFVKICCQTVGGRCSISRNLGLPSFLAGT